MPKHTRLFPAKHSKHPGYSLMVLDDRVQGCEFHISDKPVYTSTPIALHSPDGTIYTQSNLMRAIVGETHYWLIYYSFHLDEVWAWVEKDKVKQELVKNVARFCLTTTLGIISESGENNKLGMPMADHISLCVENKIPEARILEFGELPNGISSSDLVTNVPEVVSWFLGEETAEADKMPCNLDKTVISNLVASDAKKSQEQSNKRKAKQEKRQKKMGTALRKEKRIPKKI